VRDANTMPGTRIAPRRSIRHRSGVSSISSTTTSPLNRARARATKGRKAVALRAYVGARGSAYALIGHFVSEQQPDVVTIYASAAAVVDTATPSLTAATHE
jgi:hypothetical protein